MHAVNESMYVPNHGGYSVIYGLIGNGVITGYGIGWISMRLSDGKYIVSDCVYSNGITKLSEVVSATQTDGKCKISMLINAYYIFVLTTAY